MKITFLVVLILLFIGNIEGQWYYNNYGVTNMNELNENQLNLALEQSQNTITGGVALTVVGTITTIVGGVMYSKGLNEIVTGGLDDGLNKSTNGALVMAVGGVAASVGIPLWVVGQQRKNIILVHLAKYNNTSYVPSIGIKIKF